jgi:hypothetical protein
MYYSSLKPSYKFQNASDYLLSDSAATSVQALASFCNHSTLNGKRENVSDSAITVLGEIFQGIVPVITSRYYGKPQYTSFRITSNLTEIRIGFSQI